MTTSAVAAERPNRIAINFNSGWVLVALIYAVLVVTVIYPLLVIFLEAVSSEGGGLAASNVLEVLSTPLVLKALRTTLITSTASVGFAALIGVTLAWFVARTDMPGKRLLDPLNMLPFYLSSVVGALSWQAIAAPRSGLLNNLLSPIFGGPVFDIYSIGGMVVVLALFYTPYVYLFTLGSLHFQGFKIFSNQL